MCLDTFSNQHVSNHVISSCQQSHPDVNQLLSIEVHVSRTKSDSMMMILISIWRRIRVKKHVFVRYSKIRFFKILLWSRN